MMNESIKTGGENQWQKKRKFASFPMANFAVTIVRTDVFTGIRISATVTADSIAAGMVIITIPESVRAACPIRAEITSHHRDSAAAVVRNAEGVYTCNCYYRKELMEWKIRFPTYLMLGQLNLLFKAYYK